jgi:hypothetical protein
MVSVTTAFRRRLGGFYGTRVTLMRRISTDLPSVSSASLPFVSCFSDYRLAAVIGRLYNSGMLENKQRQNKVDTFLFFILPFALKKQYVLTSS